MVFQKTVYSRDFNFRKQNSCSQDCYRDDTRALRYKLRMLGVPIDGPCDTFCDNESVVKNVSRPESPLKKKHNAIAYHKARESIAAGILRRNSAKEFCELQKKTVKLISRIY